MTTAADVRRAITGRPPPPRGLAPVTGADWMNFPERQGRRFNFDPRLDHEGAF